MWLPDIDVDKIIRLNRLGVSTKDIAERMGTQQQYVQKLLKKNFPDYVRYVRTGGKSSSPDELLRSVNNRRKVAAKNTA